MAVHKPASWSQYSRCLIVRRDCHRMAVEQFGEPRQGRSKRAPHHIVHQEQGRWRGSYPSDDDHPVPIIPSILKRLLSFYEVAINWRRLAGALSLHHPRGIKHTRRAGRGRFKIRLDGPQTRHHRKRRAMDSHCGGSCVQIRERLRLDTSCERIAPPVFQLNEHA